VTSVSPLSPPCWFSTLQPDARFNQQELTIQHHNMSIVREGEGEAAAVAESRQSASQSSAGTSTEQGANAFGWLFGGHRKVVFMEQGCLKASVADWQVRQGAVETRLITTLDRPSKA
jgi:hypothetical protein